MIPPEPDPPTPTVPEYTYASSESIVLGSVTGTLYRDIQFEGSACKLNTQDENYRDREYPHLILYDDVLGDHQCYFARGTTPLYAILGNNSEIGQTNIVYSISNGSVNDSGIREYILSSTPSDYYQDAKTRNLTLTQRS